MWATLGGARQVPVLQLEVDLRTLDPELERATTGRRDRGRFEIAVERGLELVVAVAGDDRCQHGQQQGRSGDDEQDLSHPSLLSVGLGQGWMGRYQPPFGVGPRDRAGVRSRRERRSGARPHDGLPYADVRLVRTRSVLGVASRSRVAGLTPVARLAAWSTRQPP